MGDAEGAKKGALRSRSASSKGPTWRWSNSRPALRDWPQAPYTKKSDVDANYKRMVTYGCDARACPSCAFRDRQPQSLRYRLCAALARGKGVENEVNFEMLEGMADHIRRVVQKLLTDILLYCPVATKEDFQSAIAYLIRRLDENTGPDNFLRHTFGLKPGTTEWEDQVLPLLECVPGDGQRSKPSRAARRTAMNRRHHLPSNAPFENEADTDFSLPQNRDWAEAILQKWKQCKLEPIPLVIGGKEMSRNKQKGTGSIPAYPERVALSLCHGRLGPDR